MLVALSAACVCACTAEGPGVGYDSGLPQASLGLLSLERTSTGGDGEPVRTVLEGAFIRYHGLDAAEVLRLLGRRPQSAPESCRLVSREESYLAARNAEVELVNVGAITIHLESSDGERAPGAVARLDPRTFPELASFLGGVFYAGDEDVGAPRPGVDEYVFSSVGRAEWRFEAAVVAPFEPRAVLVDGADARGATLDRRNDVWLTWEAVAPLDVLDIELVAGGATLSCSASDDGAFAISRALLSELPYERHARLTVRRVRSTQFAVRGIGESRATVAAGRIYAVDVR